MIFTVRDLEKFRSQLSPEYADYQLELPERNIVIMGPSDIEFSEIGAELIRLLGNLTIPELFPDWELPIDQLWPPVFD